jgi:hypothetical protein
VDTPFGLKESESISADQNILFKKIVNRSLKKYFVRSVLEEGELNPNDLVHLAPIVYHQDVGGVEKAVGVLGGL